MTKYLFIQLATICINTEEALVCLLPNVQLNIFIDVKLVLFDDILVILSKAQSRSGYVFHDRGPSGVGFSSFLLFLVFKQLLFDFFWNICNVFLFGGLKFVYFNFWLQLKYVFCWFEF